MNERKVTACWDRTEARIVTEVLGSSFLRDSVAYLHASQGLSTRLDGEKASRRGRDEVAFMLGWTGWTSYVLVPMYCCCMFHLLGCLARV